MGMFKKKVRVSNSKEPDRCFEEEFWVDAGALYSFIPEDYLEKIGVEPSGKRNLILADGRRSDTRLLGFCDFQLEEFEGRVPCPVIFGPKGSLLLAGDAALENLGVEVDPIQKNSSRYWPSSEASLPPHPEVRMGPMAPLRGSLVPALQ